MDNKVRDSNYELLRTISMFLIVLYHTILHGRVLENTTGVLNFVFNLILIICVVHVNCFILIMGYYQSKSKFKIKKIISFIFQVFFYNLVINSVLKITHLVEYTNIDFLNQISPFNLSSYWFIQCYIVTYLLSPFINKFIEKTDKTTLKKLIGVLIGCICIFPYFTFSKFYSSTGFGVEQFILMYFIGAYVRKYNLIDKTFEMINIVQRRCIYIIIFMICIIFNFSLYILGLYMQNLDSNILRFVAENINWFIRFYNNPIIVIQSVAVFLLFGTFQFKNKFINNVSALSLGVYFIHQSYYIKNNLYMWIGLDTGNIRYGKSFILNVIVVSILIYIACLFIEKIRQLLFKYANKIKIVNKVNNSLCHCINEIVEIK